MATIEEVRSKLKDRLGKFKVQTPTRVAYLGDGRGNATSNMVPVGEPNKFWARESFDGDKPFKITNKNPNLTPAFNLPVLLGYPEYDPETEQVLGLHSALIKLDAGGNVSGSSIGGAPPHHQKHEWGGGDTVYVDPRMFKPGLVKPTAPASMRVKVLSFQHYYNYWRRYDGGTSPDLTQYIPSSDYRYVMLTLDPDTNQLNVRPGAVFTPDLSIDSIISNQATNTFRHIPVPPGNEIPLGVALLESDTTKIDWNPEGINNLLPMRILLSTPMKEINERISLIESATGISSLPQTGAANAVETDLLPGRIDGNITRLVHARSSTSETLPVLLVGEIGYVNTAPSRLVMGTASGNQLISFGSGGGASVLDELDDVRIQDLTYRLALVYDNAASTWTSSSKIVIPWFQTQPSEEGNLSVEFTEFESSFYGLGAPVIIYDEGTNMLLGTGWSGSWLEFNGDFSPISFQLNGQAGVLAEFSGSEDIIRFGTVGRPRSAFILDYNNDSITMNTASAIYTSESIQYNAGSVVFEPNFLQFRGGAAASALIMDGPGRIYFGRDELTSSTPLYIDYFSNKTSFGAGHDLVVSTSANENMFVIDTDLGAVQIGTSVAGQIVDFRDHLIEVNKNQNDIDVQIRSSGNASGIFLNAGTNLVGVMMAPTSALSVDGGMYIKKTTGAANGELFKVESSNEGGYFGVFDGATTGFIPQFEFATNAALPIGGTLRARIPAGQDSFNAALGALIFDGVVGSALDGPTNANILVLRRGNNAAVQTVFRVGPAGGVVVGTPTGSHKGFGTINAQAVYDDNVLLTCYPIEYARTGSINLVEMDSKYGRGNKHTRAHDFSKQAKKLVDIKEYSNEWKTNGHLPLFPSREEWETREQIPIGELTQSMAETIELQAIHIDDLQSQIDELYSIVMQLRNK